VVAVGILLTATSGVWTLAENPSEHGALAHDYGPTLHILAPLVIWLVVVTPIFCVVSGVGRRRKIRETAGAAESARQEAAKRVEAHAALDDGRDDLTPAQQALVQRPREAETAVAPPPVVRSDWVPMRTVLAAVLPILLLGAVAAAWVWTLVNHVRPVTEPTPSVGYEVTTDDRQEIAGMIAAVTDDPTRLAVEKPRLWAALDRLGPARDATARRLLGRAQVAERWNQLVWKGILESCQAGRVIPSLERGRVGLDLVAQGVITESRRQEDEKQIQEAVELSRDPKTGGPSTDHSMEEYAHQRIASAKQIDAAIVELFTRPK
jgi:hypothetical protein